MTHALCFLRLFLCLLCSFPFRLGKAHVSGMHESKHDEKRHDNSNNGLACDEP
jgi:hypothetical protein